MKARIVLGNQKLEEKLLADLGYEAGSPADILIVSRKWEKGGTDDLLREVEKAVREGCSYVVPVLGRKDVAAREIQEKLELLGVPAEAVLYGNPVRYSQLLEHTDRVVAEELMVDPVVWSATDEEDIDEIIYADGNADVEDSRRKETGPVAGVLEQTPEPGQGQEQRTVSELVPEPEQKPEPESEFVQQEGGTGQAATESAAEPVTGNTGVHTEEEKPVQKKQKVIWFMSPLAGVGQTTLVSSVFALQAEVTGERLAIVDFCHPPAVYLKLGDPEAEDHGDRYIARTKWGDLIVPKTPCDPKSAREFVAGLAGYSCIYVDTPAGWDTREFDLTVTVVDERPECFRALKTSGIGRFVVLNNLETKGANFLQGVLKNEFRKGADVIVSHDPEAAKAVEIPAVLKSDIIAKGAGEIVALLAGVL